MDSYLEVVIFVAAGFLFVPVTMLVGKLLRPHRPYAEKLVTYECGEPSHGSAQIRYHARYYLFGLLFLVFDIETVFLYPWAVMVRHLGPIGLIEMVVFIAVLVVGLVYAWREGVLEWV
ncbi:MAG: NADH-quinone oxidoreductase subunit A [Bacillota bacterium]|nr:NADH-quinone oxidoreductase subunit A [Bacillota bacterium]